MKTLLKSSMTQGKAWLLASVLLGLFCRALPAQTLISNYQQFATALADKTITNINNFQTNVTISLTTAGQRLDINRSLVIDGSTNGVVFTGNGLTRIFNVATNCQLSLFNLQLINGQATNGGAIYSQGALIISNCIIAGNSATNVTGTQGASSSNGNGASGTPGGTAQGGAIYSAGPLAIYNSVVGTNSVMGGNGGSGGSGSPGLIFGGLGGSAGSGGSAYGAAVYTSGSNNVFVSSEFLANTCSAGSAGSGGAGGTGSGLSGIDGGAGAPGGSAEGGAVYVAGSGALFVTNCLFAQNTLTAGASGADGAGNNGFIGGSAEGGGVYVYKTVANAWFVNSVFFENTCTSGAGGSTSAGNDGGNGGTAAGGGLSSAARLTTLDNCTLATNTLTAAAGGSGMVDDGSGGSTGGWDIFRVAGVVEIRGSILSGGTNTSPNIKPNVSLSVTDEGYNISSDASLVRLLPTTMIDSTNTFLDSGLAADGGSIGPEDLVSPIYLETLAIVVGSIATNYIPGVPGLSFPATDELGNDRGTPTSAGAFEFTPITIDSNASPPSVTLNDPTDTNIIAQPGETVTLSVTAVNNDTNNTLGFQWQLNGTNLTENHTFMGTTTSNLTINGMELADEGSYQVIASVSLLESAATSSIVEVSIKDTTKITVQPVSKLRVPNGGVVTFNVTATGTPPLTYQWYQITAGGSTTNTLADGDGIFGATTNALTLNPATTNDAGSYFVVVANQFGSVTSVKATLSIVPDVSKPTLAFSLPAPGARSANPIVTGTATDSAQVTTVYYWITNVNAGNSPAITVISNTANLSASGTTTKTWAISNVFLPGTNYIAVQGVNFAGAVSLLEKREFFYESPALFTLVTNGPGTFIAYTPVGGGSKPTNGAMLNIGEGYTLTAVPAKNYLLTNWTLSTGLTVDSPTLHFIMESNLMITADFTTNLFIGAAGIYNGLFYQTSGVTVQTAGMLKNLKIEPTTGAYSGVLMLAGIPYALSSSFNSSGYASNFVKRTAAEGGSLAVEMTLDWTNGEINGSVSNLDSAGWSSPLQAEKAAASSPSAEYTVLLQPGTTANIGEVPPGTGYMLLTNHNGSVLLSGALADGTAFNQAPPMGVAGDIPVYANLYGNAGLLLGWLGLSNGTVQAETTMAWIKPAAGKGSPLSLYPDGFTDYLLVAGSGWAAPSPKDSPFSILNGSLAITNADLDLAFTVDITNDTVAKASGATTNAANSLTGTVTAKTGLLTITFGNGDGKATTVGYGAILQDTTNAGGYFVTRTNAGSILLTP